MKAKALAREAEEERLKLEQEEEERRKEKEEEEKKEKEKEKEEEKKEEKKEEMKVEEVKAEVQEEVQQKVPLADPCQKDELAKKIQEKINELQAPCQKDATLQPSQKQKQVEKWAGQGHMIWRKKEKESPCQKDSGEAASSSCQKRKKPPSSSSPDWDISSPEPSSAPEDDPPCQKVDLKEGPKAPPRQAAPCQKELPAWVAVDWFQTIEISEGQWDTFALELLAKAGVKVWVVSFAGKVQGHRVFAKCKDLEKQGLVQHTTITAAKVGRQGKVAVIKNNDWGIKHLFDDNWDICQEAWDNNLTAYHISRKWGYPSLTKAVEAFLADHGA